MSKIICNPLNLEYRYQIKKSPMGEAVFREAADPTVALFGGVYFLFASMSGGFWYSDDLADWKFKQTPELPYYDYAPDVREINGRLVFSASRRGEPCSFYASADPLREPFEEIATAFDFWDPALFADDDGRVYFYWGCTNTDPIWGMEVDPVTLQPLGEKIAMFGENEAEHGWERKGDNNKHTEPRNEMERLIRQHVGYKPFIEGAFMNKRKGKYYLQYAGPGTECNVYADGVYVSDKPLGPYVYAAHNPFSSRPGGFITSAGHGSTFCDKYGNWWHVSTMRVSVNDNFERRIGLFPCAFDADGLLYCNQNFADYPFPIPDGLRTDMGRNDPEMQLLSYCKRATASSYQPGCEPEHGMNENIRTWWAAEQPGDDQWYELDLGKICDVQAIQINFADHRLAVPDCRPEEMHKENIGHRLIMVQPQTTQYLLEGSSDGKAWITIRDTRGLSQDLPHDFFVLSTPQPLRILRLSHMRMPFGGVPAVSGLRVFGMSCGETPLKVTGICATRENRLNILLRWEPADAASGYNVRYGIAPDKLYSCWQVQGASELDLSMINAGQSYYIAVDAFNKNGVTPGTPIYVE